MKLTKILVLMLGFTVFACNKDPVGPSEPKVAGITVSPASAVITALHETRQFTAEARDAQGHVMPNIAFTWTSSDENVATVNQNGLATAIDVGKVEIQAIAKNIVGTAELVVSQNVARIEVTPTTAEVDALGSTRQFEAKAWDANGNLVPDATFTWTSSDANVATVDQNGLATSKGKGETVITAEVSDVSGTATLTVVQTVSTVEVSPPEATLSIIGQTRQFEAKARDASGNLIPDATFTWTSSDTNVAAIDQNGLATGRWEGKTTITAMTSDVLSTAILTVTRQDLIAFVRVLDAGDCGDQTDVFLMRPDGSGVRNLTNTSTAPVTCVIDEMHPDWSPDGRQIAFSSNEGGKTNVYVVNADGSGKVNLTNDHFQTSSEPAWSPDGKKIAFFFGSSVVNGGDGTAGIAMMNSDGTYITKLISVPCVGGCAAPFAPDWLPDGRIAFTTKHLDGNLEIYAMNPDGTNLTNLTNNPADDALSSGSPDGSKIAFASKRGGEWEIYVMDTDGSNVSASLTPTLFKSLEPVWSPDGSRIAFQVYPETGLQEIYVMNADGTGHKNITNTPQSEFQPAWRPKLK